ncbi:unnamed protein product [Parnassius apollo]|uniref:(apollo) hypothetical protein n=1 Tax=Parnassius apollo TaxID=110799 RepID=A0A8S3XBE1_PARAO|nr:unnamed protein product [Parnassius apollo]
MGSRNYTEEELLRILEESDEGDFSDGSDELFVSDEDVGDESGDESIGNIERVVSKSSTQELSPIRECFYGIPEENFLEVDNERAQPEAITVII